MICKAYRLCSFFWSLKCSINFTTLRSNTSLPLARHLALLVEFGSSAVSVYNLPPVHTDTRSSILPVAFKPFEYLQSLLFLFLLKLRLDLLEFPVDHLVLSPSKLKRLLLATITLTNASYASLTLPNTIDALPTR